MNEMNEPTGGNEMQDDAATHPVIAIDGGSATGKTSTAAGVAAQIGFAYVDSGSIYRAVALALSRKGITESDDPRIPDELESLRIRVVPEGTRFEVWVDDVLIGDEIRTPEVSQASSRIAVRGDVREVVRELLRGAAHRGPMVVEGRDIGTVVFPDADLKLFLTADVRVRAHRRWLDLVRLGREIPESEVERDLTERDARDSGRQHSPLRQAEDAVLFDTSAGSLEEQVARIVRMWQEHEAARDGEQ
ncbi:MAG: (d)CMP kinase [Candidatus Eisenbacteria bacterium]|uniref:Cytidylate kinase n=1 Tax=Eiseniibacteriota bacterium TaxID=2212470 RepID=A0A956NBU0_UNCEI|nr:(d)CMP kinase [Candidatus Eisenbacteria bacterium]